MKPLMELLELPNLAALAWLIDLQLLVGCDLHEVRWCRTIWSRSCSSNRWEHLWRTSSDDLQDADLGCETCSHIFGDAWGWISGNSEELHENSS